MTAPFTPERPLHVAVIGSGPSGVYAAEALIKQGGVPATVDVYDRLPTPYGLVRYGVAPDHQKIKSVTALFSKVLSDPRVRFLGNVEFGRDVTLADLHRHYDAIVYTVGASADRSLGIPGEDLTGSLSATEFVAWYNGHPDAATRELSLHGVRGVAVVGVGNVAVDVARILLKTVEELKVTDIADHALKVLADSDVTDVYVLGRRGPAQAKFTTKELREFGELHSADVIVHPDEIALTPDEEARVTDNTMKKNVEVLREFSTRALTGKPRRVHLRFLVSPLEITGEDHVQGLTVEHNRLDEQQNAVGTGVTEQLDVQMVLRSVGYKGRPLTGVPFDARRGVIPNEMGRVVDEGGAVRVGEYTAGWIKRGPSGVIGTNKADAVDTVNGLIQDAAAGALPVAPEPGRAAVDALLASRGARVFTFEDWLALDALELAAGQAQGRPRVKVVRREHMLGDR